MRHVFPSREVYHLWANERQPSARNSSGSVSYDGEFAYSYRAPIARSVRNAAGARAVLFGIERYSVTTAKHQSHCRQSVPSYVRVFHVAHLQGHDGNLRSYSARIIETQGKAKRARTYKAMHLSDMVDLIAEARDYCEFFSLDASQFSEHNLEQFAASIEQARAEQAEHERKAAAERRERMRKAVPLWLAGERVDLYGHPDTLLRLTDEGETVETSRGARVPVADACRLFAAWERGLVQPGMTVGHYMVISSTPELLTIGCHQLAAAEIRRFAVSMGWADAAKVAA